MAAGKPKSRVPRARAPKAEGRDPGPVPAKADLAEKTRAKPGQQAPASPTAPGRNVPVKPQGPGRSSVVERPGRGVRDQAANGTGSNIFARADASQRRTGPGRRS